MSADPRHAVEAVWRIESPRLLAGLARLTRDVGVAEDLAQEALVAALGINGYLLTVASERARAAGGSVHRALAVGGAVSITLWLLIVYVSSWLMVAA